MPISHPDRSPTLRRHAEAERILMHYGSDAFKAIMELLERHFLVLHNRAQVLLTLCGIIISTTGFSGRNIAGGGLLGQVLIICGIGLILISAAVVCWGVLHLRWLTMQPGEDIRLWLINCLRYRDRKTTIYRLSLFIMLAGLTAYGMAIILMLLNPHSPNYAAR